MNDILFRGKKKSSGEWVYGGSIIQFLDDGELSVYMPQFNSQCVTPYDEETDDLLGFEDCRFFRIDPETVCRYTGLKDKNGKNIYEGDILQEPDGELFFVDWSKDDAAWRRTTCGDGSTPIETSFDWFESSYGEVIGNIYDNPEMVEVQK